MDNNWNKEYEKLIQQSTKNINYIKDKINEAIAKIPIWSTRNILIIANDDIKNTESELVPAHSFSVDLHNGNDTDDVPNFSVFLDEDNLHLSIEDVLEAGDNDFFQDNNSQRDYFNLIQSLKGRSIKKEEKNISLYTARPTKDRQTLLNSNEWPVNIFLTSNYDFAENFGLDYNENRDIWKVTINTKFLIETLNSPGNNQYQTFSPDGMSTVPIVRKNLITQGDIMKESHNWFEKTIQSSRKEAFNKKDFMVGLLGGAIPAAAATIPFVYNQNDTSAKNNQQYIADNKSNNNVEKKQLNDNKDNYQ
jgi:hypothetical protein